MNIKIQQTQKIILFGCGALGSCCLYYLPDFFDVDASQVFIIDKDPNVVNFPTTKQAIKNGCNFINYKIKRNNLNDLFDNVLKVKKYDIIIDVTTCTPTYIILKECRLRNLLYINTSIEDDHEDDHLNNLQCPIDSSIFLQHYNLQIIADKTNINNNNITSIIEFGMNPGLISIFAKQGILDIAKNVINSTNNVPRKFLNYFKYKDYHNLAKFLKLRTIHCSEIDTQVPKNPITHNFVNTWSCVGLITEGLEPAEIEVGTHEDIIPFSKDNVSQPIPQLLITNKPGKDIKFQSLVPLKINNNVVEFTKIHGCAVHHGEGISLNRCIGKFDYAPTMHYVYQLSPVTDNLLNKLSTSTLSSIAKNPKKWKVLNMHDDDLEGYDNVGALLILEENPITKEKRPYYHWTGSILNTDYTKNILKDQFFGPTIIQVMAGVLSGMSWMLLNKHSGLSFGDNIDNKFILNLTKKYLGKFFSDSIKTSTNIGFTLNDLIIEGEDKIKTKLSDL